MKADYKKPVMEIEKYELNASIAANCDRIISLGPGEDLLGKNACEEFKDDWGVMTLSEGTSFYESGSMVCDCYYSSGGQGYFTS